MNGQSGLLSSIAETIADYREGHPVRPTPEHVDRWVSQFDAPVRLPILREMDHVLKRTYFSRATTIEYMTTVFRSSKLVGEDPCAFWTRVRFLDIQRRGDSQKEMLVLFGNLLEKECGVGVNDCGADPHAFVYLDDAIFSGGRVHEDLAAWIGDEAPSQANLHVIVIATHEGAWFNKKKIDKVVEDSGKKIDINWWRFINLENRKKYRDSSDVLWPVSIPEENSVLDYVTALNHPLDLREPGQVGGKEIFSSDENRQILEREFLKAGVRIRDMCPYLNNFQRPLGNMILKTLGFGSLIVTFRNCPNNAPLVLWVGDPWYPLFPRAINSETSFNRSVENLGKDFF